MPTLWCNAKNARFSEKTFMDFPILDNYKNVQNAIYGKVLYKKKRRTLFLVLYFQLLTYIII